MADKFKTKNAAFTIEYFCPRRKCFEAVCGSHVFATMMSDFRNFIIDSNYRRFRFTQWDDFDVCQCEIRIETDKLTRTGLTKQVNKLSIKNAADTDTNIIVK